MQGWHVLFNDLQNSFFVLSVYTTNNIYGDYALLFYTHSYYLKHQFQHVITNCYLTHEYTNNYISVPTCTCTMITTEVH